QRHPGSLREVSGLPAAVTGRAALEHGRARRTAASAEGELRWKGFDVIPAGLQARRSYRSLLQQADDFRITEDTRQGVAHDFADQTGVGGLIGGIAEAVLGGGTVATIVTLVERTNLGGKGRADVRLSHIDPLTGRDVAELRQTDHQAVGVGRAIGHHAEAQLTQRPFHLLANMVKRLRVDGQIAGVRIETAAGAEYRRAAGVAYGHHHGLLAGNRAQRGGHTRGDIELLRTVGATD